MLKNKHVLVGITGSIAAYKTYDVIRSMQQDHAAVHCVVTSAGEKFVSVVTLEALLQNKVYTDLFGDYTEKKAIHIHLAEWADVVVIMAASADIIAKMAAGIADDLLTSLILATKAPIMVVPAMHANMWDNIATQANCNTLQQRGCIFIGPETGRLADGTRGVGHIAGQDAIIAAIKKVLKK